MSYPISAPAGFVPRQAISFGAADSEATAVDQNHPLPIIDSASSQAATSTPMAGTANTSRTTSLFVPQLGRPIWLTLSGSWTGSVALLRSTDGGATLLPLTYSDGSPRTALIGNAQAPVAEETVAGAGYALSIILSSGTVAYRLEQ
jgi:hypothetical protein